MAHYIPYHRPEDPTKVAALAASMDRDGWLGEALVAWDNHLITGAHRHAAWRSANEGDDAGIPVVQIADLAERDGQDFMEICADEGCDGIDSAMLVYVLDRCVSQQTRDVYGIDVH